MNKIVVEFTEQELAQAAAFLGKIPNESMTYPAYQKMKIAILEYQEAKNKGDEDAHTD